MRFSQNLSSKRFYARFFLLFIIYLGINLIVMRQKSRDYFVNIKRIFDNLSIVSVDVISEDRGNADLTEEILKTSDFEILTNVNIPSKIFKIDERVMEQISLVCKENNLTDAESHTLRDNFFYSPQHNGLFCWIRKSASTSFAKLFSDMNGSNGLRNSDKEISLIPKTDDLLDYLIKDLRTFRFIAVRHPFERLVSAYRDRIEDNSKFTPQAWVNVPKIFHLTRPELFKSSAILEEALEIIFHQNQRLKLIPTFEEFVRWLLQEDPTKYDSYWDRYYEHCSLCSVRYHHVLKLDNYTSNELDFISDQLNLNGQSFQIPKLEESRGGRTNFDQTCNYFKNLSHASIVSLYEKYRFDFDMFNYDFDKYFECIEGD